MKIEVCFSLQAYFRKFTPSVGKIYPRLRTPDLDLLHNVFAVSGEINPNNFNKAISLQIFSEKQQIHM